MSNTQHLLELFADNNPVPSLDQVDLPTAASLHAIRERRSEPMADTKTLRPIEPGASQRRRRTLWVAGAAAAAVIVAAVVVGSFMLSRSADDVVEPAPEPEAEALEVVEQAIAASNANDFEALVAHYAADGRLYGLIDLANADHRRALAGIMEFTAAIDSRVDVSCEVTGTVRIRVVCEGTSTDILNQSAGVDLPPSRLWFNVSDGEITDLSWSGGNFNDIIGEIAVWVALNQPEFYSAHFEQCSGGVNCAGKASGEGSIVMNADSGAALVEILPVFLEASDKYPLS